MRTGALTVPSHVPVQLAEQVPESSAGVQLTVTSGGVQLPLALQFPSQLASTSTLTEQPPPEMLSPHDALAETPASSVSARTAVIPAEAALHAAVTWSSSDPPGDVNVAWVTPAAERSFAMPVHAVKTDFSISLWMLPSDVTADANAFASPSPLQLEFAIEVSEFAELHPLANAEAAKRKPTPTPDFQATILAMRSSPCAKRREPAAPKLANPWPERVHEVQWRNRRRFAYSSLGETVRDETPRSPRVSTRPPSRFALR
jgi:hypothetical protein